MSPPSSLEEARRVLAAVYLCRVYNVERRIKRPSSVGLVTGIKAARDLQAGSAGVAAYSRGPFVLNRRCSLTRAKLVRRAIGSRRTLADFKEH
jgi:hypothetical protein